MSLAEVRLRDMRDISENLTYASMRVVLVVVSNHDCGFCKISENAPIRQSFAWYSPCMIHKDKKPALSTKLADPRKTKMSESCII